MHLDVIGMAIPAVVVVDGERIRAFLAKDRCQPVRGGVNLGHTERIWMGVAFGADHS
jgi:hypothetical protein